MPRPSECFKLIRADVILPLSLMLPLHKLFLRIRDPKMRRATARREHVCIDEPWIVLLVEERLVGIPLSRRLFKFTAAQFRACCSALVSFFGVSTVDGEGITPASFRSGGATLRCLQDETLDSI